MKKENDRSTCFVVCAIILLVLASVACLACANCMSSNFASIMGGVLSVAATTLLGVIAVWQNRKYKELSDEKSKQAEELMFTPECRLFDVCNNSQFSVRKQIAIVEKGYSQNYYLQFFTLNLTMIDITVEEIAYCEKANDNHKALFSHNKIGFSIPSFTMFGDCNNFEIEINIPTDFLSVDTICRVTLEYKNIYDSVVHKTVEFERSANGHIKITKQERAILVGKNVEVTANADA